MVTSAHAGKRPVGFLRRFGRGRRSARDESEVEARRVLEGASGCGVCAAVRRMEARDLRFFVAETHTQAFVVDRIAAAGGLCAEHLQQLIARQESTWVGPSVYSGILSQVIVRLGHDGAGFDACPLCLDRGRCERELVHKIVEVLDRPPVRDAYSANGGFCLPHLRSALALPPPAGIAALLLRTALSGLRSSAVMTSEAGPGRRLAGAVQRVGCQAALWQANASAGTYARLERGDQALRDWLRRLVAHEVCPVCSVQAAGEWRYLVSGVQGGRRRGATVAPAVSATVRR